MKTTFLHGELDEQIYLQQPEGFKEPGKEGLVCRLTKSLYSLKQTIRQWYKRFDTFIVSCGYTCCEFDYCVYFRKLDDGSFIYLTLYVDDMLIAAKSKSHIFVLKNTLSNEFEIKDLRDTKKILGIEIYRDRKAGNM